LSERYFHPGITIVAIPAGIRLPEHFPAIIAETIQVPLPLLPAAVQEAAAEAMEVRVAVLVQDHRGIKIH
jgi:hypothetical protein